MKIYVDAFVLLYFIILFTWCFGFIPMSGTWMMVITLAIILKIMFFNPILIEVLSVKYKE